MQQTVYLRPEEIVLFEKIDPAIRRGWIVTREEQTYDDKEKNRQARWRLLNRDRKKMRELRRIAVESIPPKETDPLDLSAVPHEQLLDVIFTMGPDALTEFVLSTVAQIRTPEDMQAFAEITRLRNSLFSSLNNVPA